MKTFSWVVLGVVVVAVIVLVIVLMNKPTGMVVAPATSGNIASTPTAASTASAPVTQNVVMTRSTSLGSVITGINGMTLYIFKADTSGVSNCNGACASAWPPLTIASGVTPKGQGTSVTLGVIKRTDGSNQITANGMPLYYFNKDSSPGDMKGQGVNAFGALWYVISPSGQIITTSTSSTSTSTSSSSNSGSSGSTGGYGY